MSLEAHMEGILFYAGTPMTRKAIAKTLQVSEEDIENALPALRNALSARGITLVEKDDEIALVTAPELAPIIEAMRKEELRRDIGKAGAETLAIIAYLGSATRAEIDFIRGVNSTFILRNLMVRGLIERMEQEADRRSFAYRPTVELFAHLGIRRKEDLPQYAEMVDEIVRYRDEHAKEEGAETATAV